MESSSDQPLAIPTTTEGIAIHLGYISRNLAELNKKMDAVQNSTVGRDEWANHLKADEDHEARIRILEQNMWKQIGMASIIASVVAVGITLVIKFLFK